MLFALPRQLETVTHHAFDLVLTIDTGINRLTAVFTFAPFAGLAVIDSSGQFANDHEVHATDDLRLEWRRSKQLFDRLDRPHVREQPQLLTQGQQRLLGPLV